MDGLYGDSTRSVKAVGSEPVPGSPVVSPPVLASTFHLSPDETSHSISTGVTRIQPGGNWSRRSPNSREPRRRWCSVPGWPLSRRCCGCLRSQAANLWCLPTATTKFAAMPRNTLRHKGSRSWRRRAPRCVPRRPTPTWCSRRRRPIPVSMSSTCTGWRWTAGVGVRRLSSTTRLRRLLASNRCPWAPTSWWPARPKRCRGTAI